MYTIDRYVGSDSYTLLWIHVIFCVFVIYFKSSSWFNSQDPYDNEPHDPMDCMGTVNFSSQVTMYWRYHNPSVGQNLATRTTMHLDNEFYNEELKTIWMIIHNYNIHTYT